MEGSNTYELMGILCEVVGADAEIQEKSHREIYLKVIILGQ